METVSPAGSHKKSTLWGKLIKYGLPVGISFGLCYVLFRNMDFGEMVAFVKSDCYFPLIFMSMGVGVLTFVIRGLRWRIQLRAAGVNVPAWPVINSIIGTYAVNLVVPRLGEFWRSEYIARRQKAPFGTVFGSVVAERASDTIVVLMLFGLTFFLARDSITGFFERPDIEGGGLMFRLLKSPWTYVTGTALIMVAVVLMRRFSHNRFVARVMKVWNELVGGFCSIFRMKGAWKWLLLTVALWSSYFFQLYLCFEAFGMTRSYMAADGLILVLVCYVLGSVAMGLPTTGGIGPYQIAIYIGISCFVANPDSQKVYSFANTVLGAQMLVTIVSGLVAFAFIMIDNRKMRPRKVNG